MLRFLVRVSVLVLVATSCSSVGQLANELVTTDTQAIATTAPVGLPLIPTPTPIVMAAVVVPLNTPTPPAETQARTVAPADTAPTAQTQAPTVEAAQVLPTPGTTASPTVQAVEPTPASEPTPTAEPAQEQLSARSATNVGYRPLGRAAEVDLVLPVARIELIGFHEAGHPGSKAINAAGTGVGMLTMDSRSRETPARSAADIVVPPGEPVVAPATGTVIAANPYVLYCEHEDQLVYIEPDGMTGWQVRVFHIEGPSPAVGTWVEAGVTQIATSARVLPFESQVDEFTDEPSWPHVHIEVVDTSVPDTRPPGPGCP